MNEINKKISWTAPEFTYYDKNKKWYVIVIIIALILATVFVLLKSYSGAAVIVASALVFITQGATKPKDITFMLDNDGVHYKEKSLAFNQFREFWVSTGEAYPKLYLQKTGKLSMPISILLKGINPDLIINFLKQYLPYGEKKGEMIHENINKMFRF